MSELDRDIASGIPTSYIALQGCIDKLTARRCDFGDCMR